MIHEKGWTTEKEILMRIKVTVDKRFTDEQLKENYNIHLRGYPIIITLQSNVVAPLDTQQPFL